MYGYRINQEPYNYPFATAGAATSAALEECKLKGFDRTTIEIVWFTRSQPPQLFEIHIHDKYLYKHNGELL